MVPGVSTPLGAQFKTAKHRTLDESRLIATWLKMHIDVDRIWLYTPEGLESRVLSSGSLLSLTPCPDQPEAQAMVARAYRKLVR